MRHANPVLPSSVLAMQEFWLEGKSSIHSSTRIGNGEVGMEAEISRPPVG